MSGLLLREPLPTTNVQLLVPTRTYSSTTNSDARLPSRDLPADYIRDAAALSLDNGTPSPTNNTFTFGFLTQDDRTDLESRNPGTTDGTVSFGCITYDEDGAIYIGYLRNGLPHHYGRLIYGNDVMYQGHWLDGVEHGRGTLQWYDGTKWDGDFWQGKPNGHGYYYPGNGANPMYCELVGAEVQVNSLVKIEDMGEEVEV